MATQLGLDLRQEKTRLSKQCSLILGRLLRGPATNTELSHYALKYTGRISDLRAKGHDVRVVGRDYQTGVTTYALYVDGWRCR